jgi:hypothetical protein
MTGRWQRMLRGLVVVVVGVAVFLVTPYFVYDRLLTFQFGEAEMRAAVEGTWIVELMPKARPARSITLTIEQSGASAHSSRERRWVRAASACGHRSFIRNAEACLDSSDMELKLIAVGGDASSKLSGKLSVSGTRFDRGRLELQIDDSHVSATISSTGEVLDISMYDVPRYDARTTISRQDQGLGVTTQEGAARLARIRPRS